MQNIHADFGRKLVVIYLQCLSLNLCPRQEKLVNS